MPTTSQISPRSALEMIIVPFILLRGVEASYQYMCSDAPPDHEALNSNNHNCVETKNNGRDTSAREVAVKDGKSGQEDIFGEKVYPTSTKTRGGGRGSGHYS